VGGRELRRGAAEGPGPRGRARAPGGVPGVPVAPMSGRRRELRPRQVSLSVDGVLGSPPLGSEEKPPDPARQVAPQAAQPFSPGPALGLLSGQELPCRACTRPWGHRDAVESAVEPPVAATVEAVAAAVPEEAEIGATPARRANLASDANRPGARGLGDQPGGGRGPAALRPGQPGCPCLDRSGDLAPGLRDPAGAASDPGGPSPGPRDGRAAASARGPRGRGGRRAASRRPRAGRHGPPRGRRSGPICPRSVRRDGSGPSASGAP